jgi:clan AA aspartic protease
MGPTVLELEVANPARPEIAEKVEFLIDSGANYSVVPSVVLERLGIRPLAQQEFRLTDGSRITRKKGAAVYKYDERAGGADAIFGEEGDCNLLGAFTLAALGLFLDPFRCELKPLPMILAETGVSIAAADHGQWTTDKGLILWPNFLFVTLIPKASVSSCAWISTFP